MQPDGTPARSLTELNQDECWHLLESVEVGRLAWISAGRPAVVPVNYLVEGHSIVIRTSPYSLQAREVDDAPVAFEIDEFQVDQRAGWSVLVHGKASFDFHGRSRVTPDPWPEGQRPLRMIIEALHVTGRKVG